MKQCTMDARGGRAVSPNRDQGVDIPRHRLPKHVAIIMDGNNRWAKRQGLNHRAGYRAGIESLSNVMLECARYGIEVLSLFAFSSENWRRPIREVNDLMELFFLSLRSEVEKIHRNGIRLRIIGDIQALSKPIQKRIKHAELLTKHNTRATLIIAANYGGQWDITQAAKQIAHKMQLGVLNPEDVNGTIFQQHLVTAEFAVPDLLIRTGGEYRISNFMLWQLAYTELYFTDVLWPDFTCESLQSALLDYSIRQRRFGRTSEQIVMSE